MISYSRKQSSRAHTLPCHFNILWSLYYIGVFTILAVFRYRLSLKCGWLSKAKTSFLKFSLKRLDSGKVYSRAGCDDRWYRSGRSGRICSTWHRTLSRGKQKIKRCSPTSTISFHSGFLRVTDWSFWINFKEYIYCWSFHVQTRQFINCLFINYLNKNRS